MFFHNITVCLPNYLLIALKRLLRLAVDTTLLILFIVPDPAYLVKKIPFWKLTVTSWNVKEFKGQTAILTDDMISVFFRTVVLTYSNISG